jgi:hypothetical protein
MSSGTSTSTSSSELEPLKLLAAGHASRGGPAFLQAQQHGRPTILKPYNDAEAEIYQRLHGSDDEACAFIPRF